MRACNEQLAADLVARVVGGDERSFDELYRIYGRRVYAFALRSLRDPHEAEQVVIDTMYEVWRRADSFNHACRFTTWLLGIARNKALHVLRARRPGHDDLDAAAELPAPAHEDPYHMVSDRQRRDCLLLGFEALPFEQQQCVQYALVDGLSLSEIARLQDCPENTVKSRLFKARRKLRRSLEEFDGEGHEAACEDDYVTPLQVGTDLAGTRSRKLAVATAE
jgi:RNA polymerase sigma-70 factor (ECF subfamily)